MNFLVASSFSICILQNLLLYATLATLKNHTYRALVAKPIN